MLLELKNISFSFSQEKKILNDLSLNIVEGEIYALMGGNGTGKTTLFNIITGFYKLQHGKTIFKGQNITNNSPHKINQAGIGRTFQDLRLVSKLTVKENVLLAMKNNPTDSWVNALLPPGVFKNDLQSLEKTTDKIIEDYFLVDIKHSMAHEISFGQQKLLNIACCIANGAELLLLDEPVAGISPQYRELMTKLIRELKQEGKTILMIEHNTDFITETADRFLFMNDGNVSQFDKFSQLLKSKEAADAYF
jgi:ABC-type branched-subunit amino acid transport system ATPase component